LTLLAVVLVHAALFVTLHLSARVGRRPAAAMVADVLLLPPIPAYPLAMPRSVAERVRPPRIDTLLHVGATDLDSFAPRLAASSAAPLEGSGSGVDWAAEARRALQAYEIRKRQPLPYDAVASEPAEDGWWPRAQHRAGEQFKTAAGDWIVWINDDCYQIATPVTLVAAPGATRAQTVCRVRDAR
jgi:hypothetical protein